MRHRSTGTSSLALSSAPLLVVDREQRRAGRHVLAIPPQPVGRQFKVGGRPRARRAHRVHQILRRVAVAARARTRSSVCPALIARRSASLSGTGPESMPAAASTTPRIDLGAQQARPQQCAAGTRIVADQGLHHQLAGREPGAQLARVAAALRGHGIQRLTLFAGAQVLHGTGRRRQQHDDGEHAIAPSRRRLCDDENIPVVNGMCGQRPDDLRAQFNDARALAYARQITLAALCPVDWEARHTRGGSRPVRARDCSARPGVAINARRPQRCGGAHRRRHRARRNRAPALVAAEQQAD